MLLPTAIWSPDKIPHHPKHCPIDPAPLTRRVVERFTASSGEPGLMAQTGQHRDQTNGEEIWPTTPDSQQTQRRIWFLQKVGAIVGDLASVFQQDGRIRPRIVQQQEMQAWLISR